jgi:DNA-binding transcriptional LysR family regulator
MATPSKSMDWDKLKVFHAAAEAGSFTHAGERLGLSQSAVSRQVSALEGELSVSLFHRHARGLILTEQGELLYRTAHEVFMKLEAARTKLTDSRERPNGELKVSTTPGIGVHWLTPRLGEFLDLYPDIHITLLTTDEELDLAMREADVAIRMHPPKQPDLVQRHLMAIEWRVCASPDYLKKFGTPTKAEDLDNHRLILFGAYHPPVPDIDWLAEAGRRAGSPRKGPLEVNSLYAMLLAAKAGMGIAALPDYAHPEGDGLVQILPDLKAPKVDVYFVYPEELRNSKRVAVFRDFLLAKLAERTQ